MAVFLGGFGEQLHDRLRQRQVARGEQHQDAFARLLENRHLARGAHMVNTGIGTRVGQEHQSFINAHGHAVSHASIPENAKTVL